MTDLRVLVVTRLYPSHDAPGRGSFVADQVRALRAAGVEVVVAAWEPAIIRSVADADRVSSLWEGRLRAGPLPLATPRSWGAGVPVARLPAIVPADSEARHPVDLATWQARTVVPFGEALARDWPFDLIHAHIGLPDGVAANTLADRLGLPLVTTEHDGSLARRLGDDRARAAYRTLAGTNRRLLAVSDRLATQARALSGLPEHSIEVVPNLIDLDLFRPAPSIVRDPDELLWVGNRKVSKGLPELLRAVARVALARPSIRLRLIGKAPSDKEEADLRQLVDELGVADRVRFEPPVDRAGVAGAMQRAGLFIHPSPSESFGIVAIEALAVGLPVVAVSPTVLDLIGRDGSNGEAADGPDGDALAEAIERALRRRAEFDPAALSAVAIPFGRPVVVARILDIYRQLIPACLPGLIEGGTARPARPVAVSSAFPVVPSAAVLVVATRRTVALARIAELAPGAAERLTVVTATGSGALPPSPAVWIEVDPEAAYRAELERLGLSDGPMTRRSPWRRIMAAVHHPLRTVARRRLVSRRSIIVRTSLATAVRDAGERLGSGSLLAVEADDVLVIDGAGLADRLVPTGLRAVADSHDEAVG